MRPLSSRLVLGLPLLLALLGWAGCGKDSNPASNEDPAPAGYTIPGDVLAAWADALEAKDLVEYTKLLEPDPPTRSAAGFRYYPPPGDASDYTWLIEGAWDLAEELRMVGHMMDSTFVGTNGNSVRTISANVTVFGTQEVPDGILVQTHGVLQVLWSANSGAQADLYLEVLLVPDAEGYLHIREMHERPILVRSPPAVEPSGWAVIKALYR